MSYKFYTTCTGVLPMGAPGHVLAAGDPPEWKTLEPEKPKPKKLATKCPNCGAPYELASSECAYCDSPRVDEYGHLPRYLPRLPEKGLKPRILHK